MKAQQNLEKSLRSSIELYTKFFEDVGQKILLEKLHNDSKGLKELLTDVYALNTYTEQFPRGATTGIRWITADFKAIGRYGPLQNFNPNTFFPLIRSLEKMPNIIQVYKTQSQTYLGMGIGIAEDIKGYLLLPFFLRDIESQIPFLKTTTLKFSAELSLPQMVSLSELYQNPLMFLKFHRKIEWFSYFSQNLLSYLIFFLFALTIFIFKKRLETKRANELFEAEKKLFSLNESFTIQQKTANFMIHHFQNTVGSITEISKILIETNEKPSSKVFDENEQLKLFKKIHEISSFLEGSIIKAKSKDEMDVIDIINKCIKFYSYKIEEEQINLKIECNIIKLNFKTDKNAFYQLMLNLIYKALERTPERGTILINMREPTKEEECLFIINIEDNGYFFTEEEIKNFKPINKSKSEKYFDLNWERIRTLAHSLSCHVSLERASPVGNRIIIYIHENKISQEEEFSYADNIIKLFPKT
ncbi:MAG: ATP-binding protein [Alphaproteobacteria bacterium]|nr:ATP-binding protein [Alphaproteobacteria bacterium]MBP9777265.1 ATP-binding protein [Alphaproteobacteria bacterium]